MSIDEFHVIVPARYQSSRLPGKPLLDIAGKPMIQHVVEQCMRSNAASVIVATDDSRVAECVTAFSGQAVMTSKDHASGSDRIAEACAQMGFGDDTIVVNVQGDEPDMPPALINQLAQGLAGDLAVSMATASAPLDDQRQLVDPSIVKVVCNKAGHALYFSRATIPWVRQENSSLLSTDAINHVRRHLGIYAYRAGFLKRFTGMTRSPLEEMEKLEQLRVLWHGHQILCLQAAETPGPGIDTPEDLELARQTRI